MRTEWAPEQIFEPDYVRVAKREARAMHAKHVYWPKDISTQDVPSGLIEDVVSLDLLDRATGEGRR